MDNLSEKIKQLRNEYSDSDFLIEHLDKNPVQQFTNWLDDAIETKIYEPNHIFLIPHLVHILTCIFRINIQLPLIL